MRPGSLTRGASRVACLTLLACGPAPAVDELTGACEELFAQRVAHDLRCRGEAPAPADEAAHVQSCVAIAGAPGSTLVAADITACAVQLATEVCHAFMVEPACVGSGADLLYPGHDRPGTRMPGEPCMAGLQCASGHCSATGEDCGQCQRPRERGESCAQPTDLCRVGDCIDGVCDLVGAPAGADCIDYGGGECQADLMCRPVAPDALAGVCVARGAAGAACEDTGECEAGLHCAANICSPQVEDGAACSQLDGCASGWCIDGVCGQLLGGLAEGADCSRSYCRPDLICDAGVCRSPPLVPVGGACFDYRQCQAGAYCQDLAAGTGTCADLPEAGEPCTELGSCAPRAICVGFGHAGTMRQTGTCTRRGGAGEACPCADQLICADGVCVAYDPAVCG